MVNAAAGCWLQTNIWLWLWLMLMSGWKPSCAGGEPGEEVSTSHCSALHSAEEPGPSLTHPYEGTTEVG